MSAPLVERLFAAAVKHPLLTLLALFLIPAAIQHFSVLYESVNYPGVCEKDYIQDYGMIAALRAGVDPYLPIPELVERFIPQCSHVPLNSHPSPHPISMAILIAPLAGIIPYSQSYAIWACVETAALFLALYFLARIPEKMPPPEAVALALIALLSAFTSYDDIFLGQVNFTLLAMFAAGIYFLKKNELLSGLIFGAAIAIKFFGWPVALILLLKRKWRACGGLLCGFAAVQLISLAAAGWETIRHYYQEVVPLLSNYYASCGLNQSLHTLPQHLFGGYTQHCYHWLDDGALTLPLFDSPALLAATSVKLPILISIIVLYLTVRTRRIEDALIPTICFSVVASPVVWGHAGVLTYIVIASVFSHWQTLRRSPLAVLLLMLWICGVFVIPTFVPGSSERDMLAALHNLTVSLAALSAVSLALWLGRSSIVDRPLSG